MQKAIHSAAHRALCQHLRDQRAGSGLRQEDVAAALSVPQSFVSSYENAHRRLDLTELAQICEVLDLDLREVVDVYVRARSNE